MKSEKGENTPVACPLPRVPFMDDPFASIVAIGAIEGLAEASGKGGLLAVGIEVRNITHARCAEGGDAFTAFLGIQSRDRGGGGAEMVPQGHGGDVHQVTEQNTAFRAGRSRAFAGTTAMRTSLRTTGLTVSFLRRLPARFRSSLVATS